MSIQKAFLTQLINKEKLSEPEAFIYLCSVADENGVVADSINKLANQVGWSRTKMRNFLDFLGSNELIHKNGGVKISAPFLQKETKKEQKRDKKRTEKEQQENVEMSIIPTSSLEVETKKEQKKNKKKTTIRQLLTNMDAAIYINIKYIYIYLFQYLLSSLREEESKYIYAKYNKLLFGKYTKFRNKNNLEFKKDFAKVAPFKTFLHGKVGVEVFFTDGKETVIEIAKNYPCDDEIKIMEGLKAKKKIIVLYGKTSGPSKKGDIAFYYIGDKIKLTKRSVSEYVNYFLNHRKDAMNGDATEIPKADWPKHMANFKRLLGYWGDEMLQELIDQYFRSTNSFYAENSYAPHIFYGAQVIPSLIGQMKEHKRKRKKELEDAVKYNGYYWRRKDCTHMSGFGYVPIDGLTNQPDKFAICKTSEAEIE